MKVTVIHQTDLFHHHADPDDHWDLACQYALAYLGKTELKGILLDFPPRADFYGNDCGDPAAAAISQMNAITGLAVPFAVGVPCRIHSREEAIEIVSRKPQNGGIAMLIRLLEEAQEPVVLHIVGSSRDVAIAGFARPELFREKCRAIYLNAGSGCSEEELEYNVELDPFSYQSVFQLPCPIYWMPCFHSLKGVKDGRMCVGEYGTYYRFRQKEILEKVSPSVKKYFEYALVRVTDGRWLSYLSQPVNPFILEAHGNLYRNMWCTGGFLHAAGMTVTKEGEIVPLTSGQKGVFEFIPVNVTCDEKGRTAWNRTEGKTNRYLFHVVDEQAYQEAMTRAMGSLLKQLP